MTNLGTLSPFWGVRSGIEPWLMARWKARIKLPIRHSWTFFASSCRWGATRQNVSRLDSLLSGGVGQLEPRFQGEWVVPEEYCLLSAKLDTFCYLTVQTACTVLRAVILTQYRRVIRRTYRQTDRRTDGIAIASTAIAMPELRRDVKRL